MMNTLIRHLYLKNIYLFHLIYLLLLHSHHLVSQVYDDIESHPELVHLNPIHLQELRSIWNGYIQVHFETDFHIYLKETDQFSGKTFQVHEEGKYFQVHYSSFTTIASLDLEYLITI